MISIIIPAHNEAGYIGDCLGSLLASRDCDMAVQVIVSANGCSDATADIAESFSTEFEKKGWGFDVLDLPVGSKPGALNAADAVVLHPMRLYLDADVLVTPDLVAQLVAALNQPEARYASGTIVVTGEGIVSRLYARFWARLPYMATGVPGCGVFAVNAAGRKRWQDFPPIIADDYYVRLHFRPEERHLVTAEFDWPVAEGLRRLIKVRRRQNAGVAEITEKFPEIMPNEEINPPGEGSILKMAQQDPFGFLVYGTVAAIVKILPRPKGWDRGR